MSRRAETLRGLLRDLPAIPAERVIVVPPVSVYVGTGDAKGFEVGGVFVLPGSAFRESQRLVCTAVDVERGIVTFDEAPQ